MSLRNLLLKKFLPFVLVFMTLSVLSMSSSVQKIYYPLFKNFSVATLNNSLLDTYFKAKPKQENTDYDYNKIGILFQSKKTLTAITNEAKKRNLQAQYSYIGFNVTIDETFIAPLLFFFSLLIFTPSNWRNKGIAAILGSVLVMGFAYLIVYFKGLYMVSKSGIRDLAYSTNDINFFQYLHFFFSPVTIVSVVLIIWILVAFRNSDLKQLLDQYQ